MKIYTRAGGVILTRLRVDSTHNLLLHTSGLPLYYSNLKLYRVQFIYPKYQTVLAINHVEILDFLIIYSS
jgi:hypothetical protein